jgi:hypothetical protein
VVPFLRSWFEYINEFPSSVALRESLYGYPALLTAHVVTMCLFAGLIVMMDLRLVGIAYTDTPVSQVQKRLFPWQMLGMALSSITGLLLFYGQPMRFYFKIFFWVKMVLMGLAGANAMAFHYSTYRSVASWDSDAKGPFGARMAGALSIVLWTGVIVFGRLVAYDYATLSD